MFRTDLICPIGGIYCSQLFSWIGEYIEHLTTAVEQTTWQLTSDYKLHNLQVSEAAPREQHLKCTQ